MKEQSRSFIGTATLQVGFWISLLSVPAINGDDGRHFAKLARNLAQPVAAGQLTLADRVAYQYAIEEVYWRHRIWPTEDGRPKPPLDDMMSAAQIQRKVENYLRDSELLAHYWERPVTSEQLQAEMERMASQTKQPEVLHELFAALNNDPGVIAECLARPVLAERLVRNLYAHDERFHGKVKRRAESELQAHSGVSEMKHTGGIYTEAEWIQSDDTQSLPSDVSTGIRMNAEEWQANIQKLAEQFDSQDGFGKTDRLSSRKLASRTTVAHSPKGAPSKEALARIKSGVLGRLQEDDSLYYVKAVLEKGESRLKVATIAWLKEPFESWAAAKAKNETAETPIESIASYTFPQIGGASSSCTDDSWRSMGGPDARYRHTAVWTGSEMIVWGGFGNTDLNTGWKYDPSTDSWFETSVTGAPSPRHDQTAVWTGSEMIVWGGEVVVNLPGYPTEQLNDGGRYNPSTDSWVATSTTGVIGGRHFHSAVWTGSEMIVWGGEYFIPRGPPYVCYDGGRYNPSTDTWVGTNFTNSPTGRANHTAVWTGSEMIVWGGHGMINGIPATGGKYNPSTDSWVATSIGPPLGGRTGHTAVWTGTEMIVWGGFGNTELNNGWKYDPSTDSWVATSTGGAPYPRYDHTAIWTGNEMIIWGGHSRGVEPFNTGGRYNPSTDSWSEVRTGGTPAGRTGHTALWTGSAMIVWGGSGYSGYLNTGGRYDPSSDSWIATSTGGLPLAGRTSHTAVWTGSEMILWGGNGGSNPLNTGGRYNPSIDSWVATSTSGAPDPRYSHTAIWTGSEMIVWGGYTGNSDLNTGGRYNPSTDSWSETSITDVPSSRSGHKAVWTGSEMIVWGGYDVSLGYLNTGGRYNPSTDGWVATSTTGAPDARDYYTAVWTGSEMVVWGGYGGVSLGYLNTGGRYDPSSDSWVATNTNGAPDPRHSHTAVWTGREMIIWGGYAFSNGNINFNTGGRYTPGTDSWVATTTNGAPLARTDHAAVWTGSEMIVWGGANGFYDYLNDGAKYRPSADSWVTISSTSAPSPRYTHTAVWTGTEMIVWGGNQYYPEGHFLNTGGRYCAPATPAHFGNISTRLAVGAGDDALIGGFIVTGTQSKRVIVRAIGPSLPVSSVLVDPMLELRDSSGGLIRSNDNWRSDQQAEIIATGIPPGNDLESAIVATLPANGSAYTAIVRGVSNGTGVGLIEVYDLDQSVDSKLANISTRGLVRTGDNAMIAGTIVLGQTAQRVLVRAIGPSLPVSGGLNDPTLELRDGNGMLIRANNNWRSDQEAEIIATGIPPSNDLESAIVATLPANGATYTAIVRGVNDAIGVALVEVYGLTN